MFVNVCLTGENKNAVHDTSDAGTFSKQKITTTINRDVTVRSVKIIPE